MRFNAHHFGSSETPPAARMSALHDLMRAQETALLQPLLDYLRARNDVRLFGAKQCRRSCANRCRGAHAPRCRLGPRSGGAWHHGGGAGGGGGGGGGGGQFFMPTGRVQGQGIDPAHGVLRLSFVALHCVI